MSEELRRCPFCGGEAIRVIAGDDEKPIEYVMCRSCHATTGIVPTEDEAAERWNRRAESEHDYRRTKRTCRMEYDRVHCDYVCTSCGECYESDMYASVAGDDRILIKKMRYCPRCGARVEDA